MKRYVYYHFILVSLNNLILFIPHYLIQHRYTGVVMAIVLSPLLGWLMIYLFTSSLNKFPSQGLPEIFKLYHPKWLVNIVMLWIGFVISVTAIMAIAAYSILISRFLNPELNSYIILLVLMLVCGYGATRSTVTVNFIVEMVLMLTFPLTIYLMYKSISNPQLSLDAMHVVANHIVHMPNFLTIVLTLFFYTGYFNFSIFNRVFTVNFRYNRQWILPIIAFLILLITFFVPIGIHGTETVAEYNYLWSATTDASKMIYGFIERVLFFFLILLINLSITFTIVGWHMVIQFVRSVLPKNIVDPNENMPPKVNYIIMSIIIVLSMIYLINQNESSISDINLMFLVIRMITETVITLWIFILSKKKVNINATSS